MEEKYKQSFYNIWYQNKGKTYLLNTFSKAIVEIEKREIDFVKNILNNNLEKKEVDNNKYIEYKNYLVENGFLIKEDINETDILKYKYNKYYFATDFIGITLLPTLRCNFACPYCFESEKSIKWNEESVETLKKFAKKNFCKKEKVHIGLFGGEPLLEWGKIKDLFDYIINLDKKYKFNFSCSIATNGYLLNNDLAYDLIYKYNCINFQITIDGSEKTHNSTRRLKNGKGTYNQVISNFKNLIKLANDKNSITLRVNLLNNKLEDIETLLSEFNEEEKNKFKIYFRPIYNTEHFCADNINRNNLENFYNLSKMRGFKFNKLRLSYTHCEGDSGVNTFQLTPDLKIWKCMNDMKFSDANIGYIDNEGEMVINSNIFKWSLKDPFISQECINCKYLPLCWGSCPLNYLKNKKRNCFYEKDFNLVELFLNE